MNAAATALHSSVGGSLGGTKYSRLSCDADSPTHHQTNAGSNTNNFMSTSQMLQQQQIQQEHLLSQQDSRLQIMSDSVGNLRNVSNQIGSELDEQAVMLDEFGTEIENAESKLDATMRKMVRIICLSGFILPEPIFLLT